MNSKFGVSKDRTEITIFDFRYISNITYNVIVIVPFEEGVASKKLLQRAKSLGSLQPKQFVKEYLNIYQVVLKV